MSDPARLIAAHEAAVAFYSAQLRDSSRARAYLDSRGIPLGLASAPAWRVGYAPGGWTALTGHLHGVGYREEELIDAGLARRTRNGNVIDVFRDRVVFPIRTASGDVVAFTGRDISQGDGPRWLNTRRTTLYDKSTVLFGLSEQMSGSARPDAVILAEGAADVLAISRASSTGEENWIAVAPCGTALTAEHIEGLASAVGSDTPLIAAFDGDTAGQKAARKTYDLTRRWPGPVDAVVLAAGQDPASLVAAHGPREVATMLAPGRKPLLDVLVADRIRGYRFDEIEGRAMAMHSAAALLRDVADNVRRDHHHLSRIAIGLSRRLAIDPVVVVETIFPPDETSDLAGSTSANPRDQPELPPDHAPGCPEQGCDCDLWSSHARRPRPSFFRADGTLYRVGYRGWETPDVTRGHHGDLFTITFDDDRRLETIDLHAVGTVPEFWRHWLPDDARLIRTRAGRARLDHGQSLSARLFPDPVLTGHDYAHRSPAAGPSVTRVEHDPETGRTAWALATADADTPIARSAAELVADVSVKAALIVTAEQGIDVARLALSDRREFDRCDPAVTIVTALKGPDRLDLRIASAGDNHVYASIHNRLIAITVGSAAVGGRVYPGAPSDRKEAVATRFLGESRRAGELETVAESEQHAYRLPIDARDQGARAGAAGLPPLPLGEAVRPAGGLRSSATATTTLTDPTATVFVLNRELATWPAASRLLDHRTIRSTLVREVLATTGGPPAADYLRDTALYLPPTAAAFVIRPHRFEVGQPHDPIAVLQTTHNARALRSPPDRPRRAKLLPRKVPHSRPNRR